MDKKVSRPIQEILPKAYTKLTLKNYLSQKSFSSLIPVFSTEKSVISTEKIETICHVAIFQIKPKSIRVKGNFQIKIPEILLLRNR